MADDTFRLPASSYEELTKIIKAYGQMKGPASLDQVSSVAALNRTTVSANNGFLTSVGIVDGGKAKHATETGDRLSRALLHDISEEVEAAWSAIVNQNEFLHKMLMAVRIRRSMEASSLASHIAFSSGQKKTSYALTGARTIIDIMKAAGLIREKDDLLVPVAEAATADFGDGSESDKPIEREIVSRQIVSRNTPSGVSISIRLNIYAKPNELDGLGQKVRDLIKDLEKPEEQEEPPKADEAPTADE